MNVIMIFLNSVNWEKQIMLQLIGVGGGGVEKLGLKLQSLTN